ncbi:uncharacterized protein CLUP02_13144 [Colletotrichum lupini]|uniref:Uncharacterized protein n=1 Tax=Colletotrichum lupini TaxID=145971 RepID=A0A9Q8T3Q8_9PEZI|nr:uncharacterized protein CLUP02_13144 [Colletotrichum lupini]UQC87626.1 hypothetical protein CLUP02_13144 [Colletotrichum lupini]
MTGTRAAAGVSGSEYQEMGTLQKFLAKQPKASIDADQVGLRVARNCILSPDSGIWISSLPALSAILFVSLFSLGFALGAAVCSWGLKAAAPARPSRRGVALTQRSHCAMKSHGVCKQMQKLGEAGHLRDVQNKTGTLGACGEVPGPISARKSVQAPPDATCVVLTRGLILAFSPVRPVAYDSIAVQAFVPMKDTSPTPPGFCGLRLILDFYVASRNSILRYLSSTARTT